VRTRPPSYQNFRPVGGVPHPISPPWRRVVQPSRSALLSFREKRSVFFLPPDLRRPRLTCICLLPHQTVISPCAASDVDNDTPPHYPNAPPDFSEYTVLHVPVIIHPPQVSCHPRMFGVFLPDDSFPVTCLLPSPSPSIRGDVMPLSSIIPLVYNLRHRSPPALLSRRVMRTSEPRPLCFSLPFSCSVEGLSFFLPCPTFNNCPDFIPPRCPRPFPSSFFIFELSVIPSGLLRAESVPHFLG